MFRMDLPEIATSVWGVFDDVVPDDKKVEKADALIDVILDDCNDKDGYAEIAAYAGYECLREAATANVRRIASL